MILYHYEAFRLHFAEVARTGLVSLTYDHVSSPNTVTRASGSFVDDGFEEGMSLKVLGTTDNNALYTVASVSALSMSIADDEQFNSSETIDSSLVGSFYENDQKEKWPIDKVRANGFTTLTIPRPIVATPFDITCNGGATDVADGTSYTWFVSQRSPIAANWFWTVTHPDATKSGTIRLTPAAAMLAEFNNAVSSLDADRQRRALHKVFVYVQRQSDKAIQLAELYSASNALT